MSEGGIAIGADGVARCWWAVTDPLLQYDHDNEWGRPVTEDHLVFETISLESFQSGLSWLTILRKRDGFRRAFRGFDIEAVAGFGEREVSELMADAAIVRNRAKIEATVNNARRTLELLPEFGSLAAYLWNFEPRDNVALSKDLRRRGWAFVGPTTVESAMQSLGLVNDHVQGCHFRDIVERERTAVRLQKRG